MPPSAMPAIQIQRVIPESLTPARTRVENRPLKLLATKLWFLSPDKADIGSAGVV